MSSPKFYAGIRGKLHTFEILKDQNIINLDTSEISQAYSNYLIEDMLSSAEKNDYDFLYGATGIAWFLFKYRDKYCWSIKQFCNILDNMLSNNANYLCEEKNKRIAYTGLAHGIAGVIVFLSQLVYAGICRDIANKVLHKAITYLFSLEVDRNQYGYCMPLCTNKVLDTSLIGLAWCNGDLGIAYALLQGANALKNQDYRNKAIDILTFCADKIKYDHYFDKYAGFCHGTSGVMHIFQRLFMQTGNIVFYNAAQYAYQRTIELLDSEQYDLNNYILDSDDELHISEKLALRSGLSGIGLSLLSYLYPNSRGIHAWGEVFLLT
jgi:lantibiotic modifying enzyme